MSLFYLLKVCDIIILSEVLIDFTDLNKTREYSKKGLKKFNVLKRDRRLQPAIFRFCKLFLIVL